MSRLSPYLLVMCLAFPALCASRSVIGAPVRVPLGTALLADDHEREVEKYHRKVHKLTVKRTRDMQKLEAEYLKLLQRKKSIDLRKLQHRLDEIQDKQQKLERKHRLELEKIEREREQKGL